jgi:hypothetical protein
MSSELVVVGVVQVIVPLIAAFALDTISVLAHVLGVNDALKVSFILTPIVP